MVLLMLCLHLNSFAQHISMQLKNVTVKQAIEIHTEAKWIFIYICGKRSEYPEDYYGNSKEPTHREGSGTDFNRTKC